MKNKELLDEPSESLPNGEANAERWKEPNEQDPVRRWTGAALLKHSGAWRGEDLKERWKEVYERREGEQL